MGKIESLDEALDRLIASAYDRGRLDEDLQGPGEEAPQVEQDAIRYIREAAGKQNDDVSEDGLKLREIARAHPEVPAAFRDVLKEKFPELYAKVPEHLREDDNE